MKTVGFAVSVTLLAALSSAGCEANTTKDVDGVLASWPAVCKGDEMLERFPPAMGGKPLGDNGVMIPPLEQPRPFRAYRDHRGPDYKIVIVRPRRGIDDKIVQIEPDPNVDYKIRNFYPGGCEAHAAQRDDGQRTIIIAPEPGVRGK